MNSNRIHISNRFSTIARNAAVTIFTVVSLSIFLGALASNAFNVQDDVPGFVFPFIVSGFILGIIVAIARIKKI